MIKTIASVSSTTLAANDCTRRCLNMNIVTKDTADTAVMRYIGSVLAAYNSSEKPTVTASAPKTEHRKKYNACGLWSIIVVSVSLCCPVQIYENIRINAYACADVIFRKGTQDVVFCLFYEYAWALTDGNFISLSLRFRLSLYLHLTTNTSAADKNMLPV